MKADTALTVRGLILGSVIAIVFTAANVYLGLRVGSTESVSASVCEAVPAAGAWSDLSPSACLPFQAR